MSFILIYLWVSEYHLDEELFSNILPLVSENDNNSLCCLSSMEEVFAAINSLNPSSAPCSNGFT